MTDTEKPMREINYDESSVAPFTLPDALVLADGTPVDSAETWREHRRPELLKLFSEHVYGVSPGAPEDISFRVFEESSSVLGGMATRRQVRVTVRNAGRSHGFDLLIYLPNAAPRPVPVFLGLNFYGNHTIAPDPAIRITDSWVRENASFATLNHQSTEASRGANAHCWPVTRILERGYSLATIYYGDIDPDFDDGFENGVHPLFDGGQRTDTHWGAIGAWAWSLSRAVDYFETDDDIDAGRVAVMGHSRLGKTVLWAGAQDERFALTISSGSGCGGAKIFRRNFGETIEHLNRAFPHWFCRSFNAYTNNEDALPVDQHELIALVAPRAVYVTSAVEDKWADPRGEFIAAKSAEPVYRLLGAGGCDADELPEPLTPVQSIIGYHIRYGSHDVLPYDWERWMDAADRFVR